MKKEPMRDVVAPWQTAGVDPKTPVLVAFSGGADSRVLLHVLAKLSQKDGFPLYAAHVNHGIRGAEADRDQAFCQTVAEEYGVPLFVCNADVPTLAKRTGKGLEETAREVRYRFFDEVMKQESIGLLVTAHHADDNLETVLFRLCRGSGLRGLTGISRVRAFGNGHLVRPLLSVTRAEILSFCKENGIAYVTDSTNVDVTYTRNRLRAEVVPILCELFEHPQKKVTDAAIALSEDDAYLCMQADRLLGEVETEAGLLKEPLRQASASIRNRVLMKWIEAHTGYCPERVHLLALEALLEKETENAQIALVGDFVAYAERGLLRLSKRTRKKSDFTQIELTFGTTEIFDGRVQITVQKIDAQTKIHKLSTQSYIILKDESAIINSGLYWRKKADGDTLLSGGIHKKMKKLYGTADIPAHRRELLPMLCDSEGIVWAPFAGVRDGVPLQTNDADTQGGIFIAVKLLSIE